MVPQSNQETVRLINSNSNKKILAIGNTTQASSMVKGKEQMKKRWKNKEKKRKEMIKLRWWELESESLANGDWSEKIGWVAISTGTSRRR